MVQELLCQPDGNHYCVQCCSERAFGGCCNLGSLPNGNCGCKGYGGRKDLGGFPQSDNCKIVDCRDRIPVPEIPAVLSKIKALPPGEFKMGKIYPIRS